MTDATWKAHPHSSDFDAGSNWTGNIPPDGTAFFGASSKTHLTFSLSPTEIGGWTFKSGAPHYTFTLDDDHHLDFLGAGIKGAPTILINFPGILEFHNGSTAGSAHITNHSQLTFMDTSSAGKAKISSSHNINFLDHSRAGEAKLTVHFIAFQDNSSAEDAHITNTHAINFYDMSSAGDATLTTLKDASTTFADQSDAGEARLIANALGLVDFSATSGTGGLHHVSAGSIAGAGTFDLGSNTLEVGADNRSTKVSGAINDGGEAAGTGAVLEKVGNGTLTLSHAGNTYSGGTLLDGGALNVTQVGAAGIFAIGFGTGNQTLKIQNTALSSHNFANLITNLGIGDAIDLAGLKFAAGAKATLSFNTLSVKSGHVTDTLSLLGSDPTGTFKVKNDGHGGSKVVLVASNGAKPGMMAKQQAEHHLERASTAAHADVTHEDAFQFGAWIGTGALAGESPTPSQSHNEPSAMFGDGSIGALYAEAAHADHQLDEVHHHHLQQIDL